jgi:radical SAM superfamily enzyme YgiQ (UPF0313 family)
VDPNDYEYEIFSKKFGIVETARGCKFNCSFCFHQDMYGKYSEKSIPHVLRDILAALRAGFRSAYFMDLNFLTDTERINLLCKKIINQKINIKWCCQSRIENADEETFGLMKKAGCELIHVGIENSSQFIQKKIHKNINLDRIRNKIRILKKLKIKIAYFIIVGLGENREDIKYTIKFICETKPDFISVHHFEDFRLGVKREIGFAERFRRYRLLLLNARNITPEIIYHNLFKKTRIFLNTLR